MQFIKYGVNINFIGKKNLALIFSLSLIVISLGSLILNKGLKLGVDFAGGTLIQVAFKNQVDVSDIKSGLNTVNLGKSSVQRFGDATQNDFLIRTNNPTSKS